MKQDCTNCKNAKWLTTDSGRRKLSYGGECNFKVNIPNAYNDYRGDRPDKRCITNKTCKKSPCLCWEKELGKINTTN